MIGWKDHLVSDIQCVEWDVKPSAVSRDAASLVFLWDSDFDSDSRVRKFRTPYSDSESWTNCVT